MKDQKHRVAHVSEFEEEQSRVLIEIKGTEIAVFQYEGEFHALANFCPHQSGPLCQGHLSGVTSLADDGWDWEYNEDEKHYITCPWHYWKFDITTGESPHDNRYAVPTYDTTVEDEIVYVLR